MTVPKSSQLRCSIIKDVLRNFATFTGKHLCQSLFFNKVAGLTPATLLKERLWHRCHPVNVGEISKNNFFTEHLRTTASMYVEGQRYVFISEAVVRRCSVKKCVLKKFPIFTGKHLKACNLIKRRIQHKCFPVNIAKFLRTPTLKNISANCCLCTSAGANVLNICGTGRLRKLTIK